MTAKEFMAFRRLMARELGLPSPLSERKTAVLMGCSRSTVQSWSQRGTHLYVDYACQAIAHGMVPWGKNQTKKVA
jgi:predicted transcriptional regulator